MPVGELIEQIISYLEEEGILFEYFSDFDSKLHDELMEEIYKEVDFSYHVENAIERIFDNL